MTIFELFEGLDRCAPGDADVLRWIVAGLRPDATVLDAGCGRGADLPVLRDAAPQGRIVAVDRAAGFIAHVRASQPGVRAEVADMTDPPGGPFDLIWSGGAVYAVGVQPALRAWRRHLAPGGKVAFTDLVLRVAEASDETRDFFAAEGVALRGAAAVAAEIAAAGYRVVAQHWLPASAWDDYYAPVERRIRGLPVPEDAEARALFDSFGREIDLWRRRGDEYGYLAFVAVPE